MILGGSRILVAGGTGLGGQAVVRALLDIHPDIVIRVPHRSRNGAFIDDARVEYVTADLSRRENCMAVAAGCQAAVLAAAVTGGAKAAQAAPWLQVTDNTVVSAYMLEACARANVKRVVLISTASAYQPFDGPIREDQMDWSIDPHPAHFGVGWVYRFVEKACQFWHDKTGIEAAIFRLANIYGPFARFDPATANFIPALIRKATADNCPLQVWGHAGVIRDVLYVDDFASAVVAALVQPGLTLDVFNIGSGQAVTIGQVAESILRATGRDPGQVVYEAAGPVTIDKRVLDIQKARKILGWMPETELDTGVRRTADWWQTNAETWGR
jgi:GDP-L-fucose synthase